MTRNFGIRSLVKSLFNTPNSPSRRRSRKAHSVRPSLEGLEARLVPAIPVPDHVVIVVEENHSFADIIGNTTQAPYMNSLAQQGASMNNHFAISHPSQPNYLALFSGSTQGIADDNGPVNFSAPNLGSALIAKNLTFAGYSEGLPGAGNPVLDALPYTRRHNPWSDFINLPQNSVNLPFSSFPPGPDFSTLPTVSIVVPNLNDDMHDGTIQAADTWLQTNISPYLQWAQTHNSLLIVTWDESDTSVSNQIPTIFDGPMVSPSTPVENTNHYSLLRTIDDMYGLTTSGQDANVSPISDIWTTAQPAAPSGLIAQTVVFGGTPQVDLTWTSHSSNETGFKVERATDSLFTQNLTLLTTTAAGVTAFTDTTVNAGTTYFYRVRATNGFGDSTNTNTADSSQFVYDANAQSLTITTSNFNYIQQTIVSFPDNVAIGMKYTFRADGNIVNYTDSQVKTVTVNPKGAVNIANLITSDTYTDFQGPHETAEIVTVGNGGGKVQKVGPNGNPVDFLTVTTGFQDCFGIAGKADQGFILGTPNVKNVYVGVGNYSYMNTGNNGQSFYYLTGAKFVYSYATSANDFAYLYDGSGGTAYQFSSNAYSLEIGSDQGKAFQNYAIGFAFNEGVANNPSIDLAYFYDSPNNDTFTGFSKYTTETGSNFSDIFAQNPFVSGQAQVYAFSFVGGVDTFINNDRNVNHFFRNGVPQ